MKQLLLNSVNSDVNKIKCHEDYPEENFLDSKLEFVSVYLINSYV